VLEALAAAPPKAKIFCIDHLIGAIESNETNEGPAVDDVIALALNMQKYRSIASCFL
jgi:hypothetical protein